MLEHIDSSVCAIQSLSLIELVYLHISVFSMFPIWEAMWFPIVTELWIGLWSLNTCIPAFQHSVVSLVDWVKENPPPKKHMMESCFSGLAFSSLCSGIKQKCDQTKPQTMSIYKAHALYWSFVCCLCRTSNLCLCLCMHVYICLWLSVGACERMSQQEREEKDEGGRLEQCSAGVGRVVGWQMPEGFIRLEGRGREQFFFGSLSDLNTNTDAPLILV